MSLIASIVIDCDCHRLRLSSIAIVIDRYRLSSIAIDCHRHLTADLRKRKQILADSVSLAWFLKEPWTTTPKETYIDFKMFSQRLP